MATSIQSAADLCEALDAARARPDFDSVLAEELRAVDDRGLLRRLRVIGGAQNGTVLVDGREAVLLCSNNYLGLANHPEVVEAAARATRAFGASAVSSRLISGHMTAHADLEERIAAWKSSEAALLFSTGYHANVGVICSLVGAGDVVVSDELNHASIIDGCRLSRARVAIYRHNDVESLRETLAGCADARRVLVITESVFSMDGDAAPLAAIADAAGEHGAWLMVDEAHAAGVFGPNGAGLAAELGLASRIDIHMGTLGKALASFGSYVAGSRRLIDHLINRARPFIFTTGLPPSAAAAAGAALDVIAREPERAAGLRARARALGQSLRDAGLDVPNLDSQILPVMVGDARRAVAAAARLLELGYYVAAIRPPTVPAGTSRLRLSLMATHTSEQIAGAASALASVLRDVHD
ncbi:MAG TPA: 8-amino-7-oxononanoate synthase [Candidatus Limnocylindrales bacterium]|nr:8-amino-7-oxononanoate synthase [Candidatus Limnocylindrales bacterium]